MVSALGRIPLCCGAVKCEVSNDWPKARLCVFDDSEVIGVGIVEEDGLEEEADKGW